MRSNWSTLPPIVRGSITSPIESPTGRLGPARSRSPQNPSTSSSARTRSSTCGGKRAVYAEALRVLHPGGRLLVSGWLRGEGAALTPLVEQFIAASGHDFSLVSLQEIGAVVEELGFVDIDLEDRQEWYLKEATAELERLRGTLKPQFVERWGEDPTQDEIAFWEVLVAALEHGAIRPGHIRALKPLELT